MTSPQQQVAQLVTDRGYRQGWTLEQFAARQVAKLQEELGELAENIWMTQADRDICESMADSIMSGSEVYLDLLIDRAAIAAGIAFDDGDWSQAGLSETALVFVPRERLIEEICGELADIQVVVFTLAQALAELSGEPFDVVQAALDKAGKDVEREVRKDG